PEHDADPREPGLSSGGREAAPEHAAVRGEGLVEARIPRPLFLRPPRQVVPAAPGVAPRSHEAGAAGLLPWQGLRMILSSQRLWVVSIVPRHQTRVWIQGAGGRARPSRSTVKPKPERATRAEL